jgi:hypothetical protein
MEWLLRVLGCSNAVENCQTMSNENEKKEGSLTLSYGKTNSSWHFQML